MDFKIPLILFFFLFTLLSSSQAFKFYVGGSDGWTLNPSQNYNQWASRNRFQIKDTLVFKFKKGSDSVLEVKKEDYEKCIKTNPIKKLEADSELTLDRSGPFYFISGKDENCEKGQKLSLVVLSPRKQTQTPPTQSPTVPPPKSSPSPSGSPTAYTPSVSPSPVGNSPPVSPYPATSPVPAGGPTASTPSPISTPPAGVPSATPPAGGPTATSPTSAPAGGPASSSTSPTSAPAGGPASSSTSPTSAPAGGPAATPPSPSPTSTTPIGSPPLPGMPSSPSSAPEGTANPPGSSESTAPAPAPAKSSGTSVASSRFLMYSVTIVVGAALLCHGTVLG